MGDAAAVSLIVRTAAASGGAAKKEARRALYELYAAGVNDSLLALLPRAECNEKVELIKALVERRVATSVPLLLDAAGDRSITVRVEAAKAFRTLAGPELVPALVTLLERSRDDDVTPELELAVAAAARRAPDGVPRDDAVLAACQRITDRPVRTSLISVCGRIGAPSSLPMLRECLNVREPEIRLAAIRALAAWPTPEPCVDLWPLASAGGAAVERTLALRGFVRLLGLDSTRAPGETIRLYEEVMKVAPNLAERKALLSAVGETRSVGGLAMAARYLDDNDLHREAEAAILNIAEAVADTARREVVPQLKRLIISSSNQENRTKAESLLRKIERYDDYITSWDYAGPYQHEGARLLHEPFGPELPGAQLIRWTPFRSKTDLEKPWLLELDKIFIGEENLVYLRTNVWSPVEKRVRLEVGTDDGVKAWLNGKLVHVSSIVRTVAPGDDRVSVTLRGGWNEFMMKLEQGDGMWRACARVRAPDGGALEGIRVLANPE
jgi:hypothetical protein